MQLKTLIQKSIELAICFTALSFSILTGCGGGGGSSNNVVHAPLVSASPPALASIDNSYRNFKQVGLTQQTFALWDTARAYADFTGTGQTYIFSATLLYTTTQTPQTATPSKFAFYKKQVNATPPPVSGVPAIPTMPDTWVEDTNLLANTSGCIHPRKAIVADFNKDGRPDVFVACTGFDAAPFPGEKNKVVLSQPNGTYVTKDASSDVGFFHGASAADLNGDGFPDVVLADQSDPNSAIVILNKGDGTFVKETGTRLPISLAGVGSGKNYYSVELLDLNEDGKLDLIIGGHEWTSPTVAFINPGNNIFEGAAPITIPAVSGQGVVLDFVVTGTGATRSLWVLRTSGGGSSFYSGRVVQKVNLNTLTSTLPLNDQTNGWFPWVIPTVVSGINVIASDELSGAISIPQ